MVASVRFFGTLVAYQTVCDGIYSEVDCLKDEEEVSLVAYKDKYIVSTKYEDYQKSFPGCCDVFHSCCFKQCSLCIIGRATSFFVSEISRT